MAQPLTDLDCVYRPRSVALVGVTDRPGRPGSMLLANLVGKGFTGAVYPVARNAERVGGRRCYRSVAELPEPVDLAYLLLPAAAAVDAAEECAALGVRAAIVGASGFAEAGTDEGRALQERLARVAASGMRVVGPNCNGVYNAIDRISLGFNAAHSMDLRPGGTAVLSHSGALFSTMMLRAERLGLGLAYFGSVGNEADLTILDHLDYVLDQPATRVACLVIDSLPDGARFASLARRAADRGVRLLALKLGSTETGAAVAVAHSSRLAGRQDAYRSLFSSLGVGLVETVEQLMTAAAMLDRERAVPRGSRVGALVMSGGAGALLADSAHRHGVPMASFTDGTQRALEAVASSARPVNPVDTGITGGRPASTNCSASSAGTRTSVWSRPSTTRGSTRPGACCSRISSSRARSPPETARAHRAGRAHRRGTAPLRRRRRARRRRHRRVLRGPRRGVRRSTVHCGLCRVARRGRNDAERRRSLALLEKAGLPVVETHVVGDADAAVAAAEAVGWPVVLKGSAPGVGHKSDADLVAVGLRDAVSLRAAAARMADAVGGFVVQPLVAGGAEALVGLVTEPELGQFLIVGTGGVHTEAIADTALVPLGATRDAMRSALLRTRLGRVLTSSRWRRKETVDEVVEAMVCLAGLARARPLAAVDVNPLVLTPSGPVAVDALVVASDVEDDPRAQ